MNRSLSDETELDNSGKCSQAVDALRSHSTTLEQFVRIVMVSEIAKSNKSLAASLDGKFDQKLAETGQQHLKAVFDDLLETCLEHLDYSLAGQKAELKSDIKAQLTALTKGSNASSPELLQNQVKKLTRRLVLVQAEVSQLLGS